MEADFAPATDDKQATRRVGHHGAVLMSLSKTERSGKAPALQTLRDGTANCFARLAVCV
jgi:hypothetical protein